MGRQSRNKRRRSAADLPPIPESVLDSARRLGEAWKVVDLTRTYLVDMGDGEVFETTGREMLETANAAKAFVNAHQRGDREGMKRALLRMGFGPPGGQCGPASYVPEAIALGRQVATPGEFLELIVLHDADCPYPRGGGPCNCTPDVMTKPQYLCGVDRN